MKYEVENMEKAIFKTVYADNHKDAVRRSGLIEKGELIGVEGYDNEGTRRFIRYLITADMKIRKYSELHW